MGLDKIDAKSAVPACGAALAVDPNNPRLLFQMGRALQANKDDNKAREYYQKAAAQSYAGAQQDLAVFYLSGRGGLPKSDEDAARLFKVAADQGLALAQFSLGLLYETGRGGFPKNDVKAAQLYKLAADQGEPRALVRLAWYHSDGRGGLKISALEASRLCKLAADKDPTIANRECWAPRWSAEYVTHVAAILEQHKYYPTMAFLLRHQGTVVVDVKINRQGRLAYSHVRQSSGWLALDIEALSMLQRSQPFPAFPNNSSEQEIALSIPIGFAISSCKLDPTQSGNSKTACVPLN